MLFNSFGDCSDNSKDSKDGKGKEPQAMSVNKKKAGSQSLYAPMLNQQRP
jgi:hypothetical protein